MNSIILRSFLAIPWAGALVGSLQMYKLDFGMEHDICGPWGCGPPVESLIGYHSFWLLLVLPIAIAIGAYLPTPKSRFFGRTLLVVALVGTLGYASWDVFDYVSKAGTTQHAVQRFFFSLVTNVDVPMLQTALAGLGVLWLVRRRTARAMHESVSPDAPTSAVSHSP